jgi:hypothetical protein
MKVQEKKTTTGERITLTGVLRLNAMVLGLVSGILCGLTLFAATIWLVIKGGDPVGPHLGLLNQYFWGYSVTIHGSLIGFAYGFFCGASAGGMVGYIYNKILRIKGE